MSGFFHDPITGEHWTWTQLLGRLRSVAALAGLCHERSFGAVFQHIVLAILHDLPVTLVDGDLSTPEMERLLGSAAEVARLQELRPLDSSRTPDSLPDFLAALRQPHPGCKVTLFTSGTSGLPKRVQHNLSSLLRHIKIRPQAQTHIWGYCYNPTHMAGLQVFLQALMNGSSIIRLYGLPPAMVVAAIQQQKISHLSATPTFYRLLTSQTAVCPCVERITSGGEKFDDALAARLRTLFPDAKFTNVYASTEAGTIFATEGDQFTIKDSIRHRVKIVDGELCLHASLLGEAAQINTEWYRTGDLVDVTRTDPLTFRIRARDSDMINVGGDKVDPHEVESCLRGVDGVRDARVFGKDNSVLGKVLCAEVVRNSASLSEAALRKSLQTHLQEFKIPRLILFVDHIGATKSGKIKRL